ncbi:MAG: sulfatase-like hydrolase/transferase [Chthoniobacteraceae bacterium]
MKCLLLLSAFALSSLSLAENARRPNIIVISADDLGYADVGFNGCKDIPTPHIDSLAKHGVRCTNGYVSHPFCSPTRAGFMTGRYQHRFGHENNPAWLPEDPKIGLPVDQITLPQVLQKAGYVTGAVGKWHLGAHPQFHPNARGFTEYFGFLGGGHNYLPGMKGGVEYNIPVVRNQEPVEVKEYMTDELSREAAAFVTRHKAAPFFLYLAYNAVHTPLQAPEKYLSRFSKITDERRRTYAAMTSAMDDGIGQVLAAVKDAGIEKDTMIWFFSDNGGPPPNVAPTDNAPLRGHKGSVLEGGIRVPFAVQWRGHLPEGAVYAQPVSSLDVFATAAALAGAQTPPDRKMDSVNILPHLLGEVKTPLHDWLHWRTGGGATWSVRKGPYKLVHLGAGAEQLYDLDADIAEAKDLAAEKPDLVEQLRKGHEAWNAELIAPIFESPRAGRKKAAK